MSSSLLSMAKFVGALILFSAMVSGCSDETVVSNEEKTVVKAESKINLEDERLAPPSLREQGVTLLSAPSDTAGDYHKISSGMDLLYLFASNTIDDFDAEAAIEKIYPSSNAQGDSELASLMDAYRGGDQFTKRDLAKQIVPLLREKVSQFSGVSYVMVDMPSAINLGRYDFERQGFVTNNSLSGEPEADNTVPYKRDSIRYSDVVGYKLSFVNAGELDFIGIPEDAAREISKYDGGYSHNVNFRFYGFVHSVAENKLDDYPTKYVVMKITKVELVSNLLNDPVRVLATVDL